MLRYEAVRESGLRVKWLHFACVALCSASGCVAGEDNRAVEAAVDKITASALKSHVSFLASDLLEGRGTPSRGLDIAAEYIASQFRRLGLEPLANNYLQKFKGVVRGKALAARCGVSSPDGQPLEQTAPADISVDLSNVATVVRGSDPKLRNTYVVISAHYDHLGSCPPRPGEDRIFNGANDNASGVATMIEVAAALQALPRKPKRSVLFLAYPGEESGRLGSHHYAQEPLEPLDSTIVNLNLEQTGRTDGDGGSKKGVLNLTGFSYSDVHVTAAEAARRAGVRLEDSPQSEPYFRRSDNLPLAKKGIPAHTLSVCYQFPDYHKAGDESEKLDYDNMSAVTRAIAWMAFQLADSDSAPQWDKNNPKVQSLIRDAQPPSASNP